MKISVPSLKSLPALLAGLSLPFLVAPHVVANPRLGFMVNSQLYLAGLEANEVDGVVHEYLNNSATILFTDNANYNPVPSGWGSQGGMKFAAYSDFQSAINNGTINSKVSVVIYDNESWTNTPSNEQVAPKTYTTDFASLAHSHGYKFASTPARDLVQSQTDYTGGPLDDYYLARNQYQGSGHGFPPWASQHSEYYEIQAQVHTTDGQYQSFSSAADSEGVGANSSVKIMIGLSTTYGSASQMEAAVLATHNLPNVVGYFLNMSNTTADYQTIVSLLQKLNADGL